MPRSQFDEKTVEKINQLKDIYELALTSQDSHELAESWPWI